VAGLRFSFARLGAIMAAAGWIGAIATEISGGGGSGMERQNTAHVDAYNEYLINCKDKDIST
jgi:hypothetical protein